MAQICVSLAETTTAGVLGRMRDLAPLADMFEIRGDLLTDLDLLTILRGRTRPLLLACRRTVEGGQWDGEEQRRRLVLLEAVKRGYDHVEVEARSDLVDVMMEKAGAGLVVSYHDPEGFPTDLDRLYAVMTEKGADVVRIEATPGSFADVARLLEFAARTVDCGGPPLVAVALGPLGVCSRILAGRYQAPFTLAAQDEGRATEPGLLPASLMVDLYRGREISPATRVYGAVGAEAAAGLTPMVHNRAFEARGLDAVYVPFPVDRLDEFVSALPSLDLAGFSVTSPFKTEILPFLQAVDETAALCGSVNTVVVRDGELQGSTTDGVGVTAPLRRRLDLREKRVVIVGAGGAARAAALALQGKGAAVTVLARDPDRAALVGEAVGCAHGGLAELGRHEWEVLVNATPVGSGAALGQTPVPAEAHRPGSLVFDMVHDPAETRLLREAKAAGCEVVSGTEMLVAQAVAQFETWTSLEAPVEVVRSAALFVAQDRGQ